MNTLNYLVIAYMVIWTAIFIFIYKVAQKINAVEKQLKKHSSEQ